MSMFMIVACFLVKLAKGELDECLPILLLTDSDLVGFLNLLCYVLWV
jgi:hypothetical protein